MENLLSVSESEEDWSVGCTLWGQYGTPNIGFLLAIFFLSSFVSKSKFVVAEEKLGQQRSCLDTRQLKRRTKLIYYKLASSVILPKEYYDVENLGSVNILASSTFLYDFQTLVKFATAVELLQKVPRCSEV